MTRRAGGQGNREIDMKGREKKGKKEEGRWIRESLKVK